MKSESILNEMFKQRQRQRQFVSATSPALDCSVLEEACYLSNDYDLMLVMSRGVKGYVNDIVDLTRDMAVNLSYLSSKGDVVIISGDGRNVIDGIRKKHNGSYASVYFDPELGVSRCYTRNENLSVQASCPEVNCTLELVGTTAYLLQGDCADTIRIGGVDYVVDRNDFYCVDSCEADDTCEGYVMRIGGLNYRCKFVPSYDVLIERVEGTNAYTSDQRILVGDFIEDTIVEIDFDGNVLRVRDDVYVYHTRNPIPASVSMRLFFKFLGTGLTVASVEVPCTCDSIQYELSPAVNVVEQDSDDFNLHGASIQRLMSFLAIPGRVFYPSDVKHLLREKGIIIRNGIMKGNCMASSIRPSVKYKTYVPVTITTIVCDMYAHGRTTDDVVNYFFSRKLNVLDSQLALSAFEFLVLINSKWKTKLRDPTIVPYKDGYHVQDGAGSFFVSSACIVTYGKVKATNIGVWTRNINNELFSELMLCYESNIIRKLVGIPKSTRVTAPISPSMMPDKMLGAGCYVKLVLNNKVAYVELRDGLCWYDGKKYSRLYQLMDVFA